MRGTCGHAPRIVAYGCLPMNAYPYDARGSWASQSLFDPGYGLFARRPVVPYVITAAPNSPYVISLRHTTHAAGISGLQPELWSGMIPDLRMTIGRRNAVTPVSVPANSGARG